MFKEFRIGEHGLFTWEDRADLIQNALNNVVTISKLLDYEINVYYKEEGTILLMIHANHHYLFTLCFYIKPFSNMLQRIVIRYVNSNGELSFQDTPRRSIKYVMKKAEYLIGNI